MRVNTDITALTSDSRYQTMAARAVKVAAVLFIVATAATMAGQLILEGLQDTPNKQNLVTLAVVFEITNGMASAGIALAFYPVLRRMSELAATGYLGLRIVEGALGVAAAAGLMIMVPGPDTPEWAFAYHDATFLLVLIVFSCGTFCFYPVLYKYRLVPPLLSIWGMIGGAALLISCLLILFRQIAAGGTTDLILSLPIWINEMVLALWLLGPGLDLGGAKLGASHAS